MLEATVTDPTESDTVIRVLDRESDLETRYGGGFVQAIDGVAGGVEDGRSLDWFFYVNGVESPNGAADVAMQAGDRIWWDHRDWTDAMRVPAVVGAFPEPFLQASAEPDERLPVRVECAGERAPCDAALDALGDAGVSASVEGFPSTEEGEALRMLVGPWDELRSDAAAGLIDDGPAASGVFAQFRGARSLTLQPRTADGSPVAATGRPTGLIAAVRNGEDPPTWVVTGTDGAAVEDAVTLLGEETLADRYAVGVRDGEATPLPWGPSS